VREDQNGFAERVLRWALRLYSPDERAWGDAIKAESYLIVGFFPRLWWAMGGLITAFRSFRARSWNFSKRTRTSCNRSQKPVAPLGWKRALICVVVSASLLLAPGVRQGLRLVVNSWYGFVEPDISPWRTLAREADSRGDASTMACAAMRLPLEEAIPLAKRAVTKDPSLTWTYYFIRDRYVQDRVKNRDRRLELLTALSRWDPENAAPYLAIAENAESFAASSDAREFNPQWRESVDQALHAKSYSSYIGARLELDRLVIQKHGIHEEPFDIFRAYGTVPIPWPATISAYAGFLARRAEKAGTTIAEQQAVHELRSVANLGSLLRLNAANDMERFSGSEIRESGFDYLQPVLIRLGEAQQARDVGHSARLEGAYRAKLIGRASSLGDLSIRGTAAAAHLFTILMIACSLVVAITAFILAVRRTKSQFVRSVWAYAPIFLVLSSIGFLGVSYPYAQASQSYLAGPAFNQDASMLLLSLGEIPGLGYYSWYFLPLGLWFWSSIIVVGIAVCIWMGFRAVSHQVV
jgi:hypothetical protein